MFIKEVPKVLERKELIRPFVVLEADESLQLPAVIFKLAWLTDKALLARLKPYTNKAGDVSMNSQQQVEWRKALLGDIVRDWSGVNKGNAQRLCRILLEHPELFEDNLPKEIPFDRDLLMFLAEHMSNSAFQDIFNACLDQEEYSRLELERVKNSSTPSSISTPQD